MLRALRRKLLPHWTDYWPAIAGATQREQVLHLGPGPHSLPGAISADINPAVRPNFVWDLNQRPWPFADDSFEQVIAINVLEHLKDFLGAMAEIHRISKAGAVTSILVPHFSSAAAFVDPTHRQLFSARSCDYFIPGTELESEYGFYVTYRFLLQRQRVHLFGALRYIPGAEWIANQAPAFWENYLCQILRGGGVFWQLQALK